MKNLAEIRTWQSAKHRESVKRRIANKTKFDPDTGCLEWTAKHKANGGYGVLSVGRDPASKAGQPTQARVHRLAWIIENGAIPEGMYVCHKCDNPKCCNVDHLFLGTPKENMDDKVKKGRSSKPPTFRGEKHHMTSLTESDVLAIRSSNKTLNDLSVDYGVSSKTIWRIKHRKSWGHV